jgi:hypothetical protein
MKNVMTANMQDRGRYTSENLDLLLRAQVENSLEVGWEPKDILLVTNLPFSFLGVQALETELPQVCLTGSKMFAVKWLFENGLATELLWAHDLDAWQNVWFDPPVVKDVGITTYSIERKLNGGSVFWASSARGLVEAIVTRIERGETIEEPTINKILSEDQFKDRVTIVDQTFNVGCSGFVVRAKRAAKPIRVAHFNPMNRISWETHALDRNQVGIRSVSYRLEKLIRRYYPNVATELDPHLGSKKEIVGQAIAEGKPIS